ncbi:MAG: lipid-A-disaccharide synthase, partial [Acidobacteriota bacterium]|nr:lipid-A-disaccharide synthase [Acidobacteriota bacterium]
MNLLISSGEASGDIYGSRLLRALSRRRPGMDFFGMGGARLKEAGLERLVASEAISVVGIFEVFAKLPAIRKALAALEQAARQRRPVAAVLIDFPDFHALLARRLARLGIPLIYYVSPQVWAWRAGRARTIAARARRIITLFPFEAEIYRRYGADAVCAGHPLVDDVREGLEGPAVLPAPAPGRRRLVLLPGSRRGEIERHWKPMVEASTRLAERFDLDLVAVRAPGLPPALFASGASRGIRVVDGGLHPLLAGADLAFVASGTATLEAALCSTPMVMLYRTSPASAAIGRLLIRVPWISLVNIVGGETIVPELLQGEANASRLEKEGAAILESPERARVMREALARVSDRLGPPGATDRAADAVLQAIETPAASEEAGGALVGERG